MSTPELLKIPVEHMEPDAKQTTEQPALIISHRVQYILFNIQQQRYGLHKNIPTVPSQVAPKVDAIATEHKEEKDRPWYQLNTNVPSQEMLYVQQ